ncbi:MAG: hypothetical protein AB7T37_18450 [Dehalococcoidia bacterium]
MAATPRLAAGPALATHRATLVGVAVACSVLVSLALIHPLIELLVFASAPAAFAWLFASGTRQRFNALAKVGSLVSGAVGAMWLVTTDVQHDFIAVLIGSMVSFLLMVALGMAGAMILDHIAARRTLYRA